LCRRGFDAGAASGSRRAASGSRRAAASVTVGDRHRDHARQHQGEARKESIPPHGSSSIEPAIVIHNGFGAGRKNSTKDRQTELED
jgi:hypothetical protein